MRAWAGAALGLLMAVTAQGAVTARLDANQVGAGESVRLTLQYEGQTRDQPDLTPLQQDFDIVSTSRSNNMQIINGTVSSHTETQVVLSPKHAGQISMPQITWAGERSNPLTLTVSATAAAQPDSVFLETIVDQKQPYVQAAVNVTVRVYSGEQLLQASLDFAGNGDVLVQQVGADRNRTLDKNGRQYEVVERHYVLFPQKSGELKIPGPQLAGPGRWCACGPIDPRRIRLPTCSALPAVLPAAPSRFACTVMMLFSMFVRSLPASVPGIGSRRKT